MAYSGGFLGVDVSAEVNEMREHAIRQRVITADPYAPHPTPEAEIIVEVDDDSVSILDLVIQAAYMLPVVGNVMAVGDVARDVMDLTDSDEQGQPNHENAWLWGVLVIDAIGIVPAVGNASRPVRLASREAVLAFARGDGVEIAAELLWTAAAGNALEFMEQLGQWLESNSARFRRQIALFISKLEAFIDNPVDAATQHGLIDANPAWWDVLERGKRILFVVFDELADAIGVEQRQRIVSFLRQLGQLADSMVVEGIGTLLPLLSDLSTALVARKRRTGGVTRSATAVTGQKNEHELSALEQQSTREKGDNSPTPAGCACAFTAPTSVSANPIDYVMGDENLWHTDFRVPGLIDVEWTRYYRSSIDELDDSEL
ncbi:DUF6531 domain-containing protein, partial [Halomonas sp. V046]|uniref:DUF6531 domain-containing protein n=1 Tax=Halomonas sp. V046 TaxID=3459611 RepID=UPI004044D10A